MHGIAKHRFACTLADGGNPLQIQMQRDWNDEHIFAGSTTGGLLAYDSGQSDHAAWVAPAAGAGQILRSGAAGALPAWSALTIPDTIAQGDLVVGTAANVEGVIAAAAAGKVLRAAGSGTVPAWSTLTIPNTVAQGDLLTASAANVVASLADVAVGSVLVSGGVGAVPAWSATPSLTSLALSTPLGVASGGTGLGAYTIGDLLYASGAAALSSLADVAAGSYLRSGGVAAAPVWSALVLPNAATAGDLVIASATNTLGSLADVATGSVLVSGGVGVAPAWSANPSVTSLTLGGDAILVRDASNVLALRNSTTAQELRVYETFTDASNYSRLTTSFSGTAFVIESAALGTGTPRGIQFRTGGSTRWGINTSGVLFAITDNTVDIGASGANRPRDYYGAGKITSGGATAGIGYASGAGGTVAQASSKSTGVTLNTVAGQITLQAAALLAAAKVSFVVTNSAVAATDNVIVSIASGGTANAYRASVTAIAAGSFTITVENITAGSLSESPVVVFSVLKGVTA